MCLFSDVKFVNFKNIPGNELRFIVSTMIIFCQTDRSLLRVVPPSLFVKGEGAKKNQRPFTMRGDWERDSASESKLPR